MRKGMTIFYKKQVLFLLLGTVMITACQKTPIQFGQAYVDNSFSNIVLVDTISPQLSTVFVDSTVTSGSGAMLAGDYPDPYFGKVSAKSFFELSPSGGVTLSHNPVFDSLKLILIPNKSFYGDTTVNCDFSVYQLSNPMSFPQFQNVFYNNTNFAVNATALGSFAGRIYPNITDSVFINLSNSMGQELLNQYKENDATIQSATNFIAYFKGLRVGSSNGNMQAVYGFKDSATLRLYYHETDVFIENKHIDFKLYNSDNTQFNQVLSDKTGTPVAAFNSAKKELLSSETNGSAYLQYITGFVPKIKFPSLNQLYLRPDFVKIIKADLIVKPITGSYPTSMPLPPILYASETDQNNLPGGDLIDATSSSFQTGNLVLDNLYNQNTQYTYDVTSYLQQQLAITYTNQNGLLLIPPAPTRIASFNRAIFGDKTNKQGAIQLKLFYVSVNP